MDSKYHIAVKYGDLVDEIKIIEYMKKYSTDFECHDIYVNAHIVEGKNDYIVLDALNGTLYDLIKQFDKNKSMTHEQYFKVMVKIFIQLVYSFQCLVRHNLFYTDIKLENILYKRNSRDEISIILGDIGSIATKNDNSEGISLFLPWWLKETGGILKSAKLTERAIVAILGITFANLLQKKKLDMFFSYATIKKTTMKEYNNHITEIINEIEQLYGITYIKNITDLLHDMLSPNEINVPTFDKVLQTLTKYLDESEAYIIPLPKTPLTPKT